MTIEINWEYLNELYETFEETWGPRTAGFEVLKTYHGMLECEFEKLLKNIEEEKGKKDIEILNEILDRFRDAWEELGKK